MSVLVRPAARSVRRPIRSGRARLVRPHQLEHRLELGACRKCCPWAHPMRNGGRGTGTVLSPCMHAQRQATRLSSCITASRRRGRLRNMGRRRLASRNEQKGHTTVVPNGAHERMPNGSSDQRTDGPVGHSCCSQRDRTRSCAIIPWLSRPLSKARISLLHACMHARARVLAQVLTGTSSARPHRSFWSRGPFLRKTLKVLTNDASGMLSFTS